MRAALAAPLAFAALAGPAAAARPDATNGKRLDATVAYLQHVQNSDGGFGYEAGSASDPDFSAWVAYALAAAGINPQDQAKPGGVDAYAYLAAHTAELSYTTDWERVLLVAVASGTPPRDFGGADPVARILERELPDGSFAHTAGGKAGGVNDTAFAILAFALVPDAAAHAAIPAAADWLVRTDVEHGDGSWGYNTTGDKSSDMTAAAIEALNAAGRHVTASEAGGFTYLHGLQNADGGLPQVSPGGESNVASTAWTAQAVWSTGADPRTWKPASADLLDYMGSMQQPDGSIRYMASTDMGRLWMTAQVAPAFAGHQLPIPPVARAIEPQDPPAAPAPASGPASAVSGQGGFAKAPHTGVLAGGGGPGAPLFSRPQPQSRGKTAGGARQTARSETKAAASPTAAPAAATPAPVTVAPAATATPATPGSGATGLADRGVGAGGGATTPVTGTLISTKGGRLVAQTLPGAPGLAGAGAGGSDDGTAPAIAVALGLALLAGWALEVRPRRLA
jgi:prenyltransferase beta subunit